MKTQIKTIGISALCYLSIISCKKAGTDGEATLVIFPQHHSVSVPNHAGYPDSVYVFFNAKDLPSDPLHNYDAVFVGEVGEDHVHCTTLHSGKYYIYATGWDTGMNMRVRGGMAIKIKYSERKQEIDQNVPVTE